MHNFILTYNHIYQQFFIVLETKDNIVTRSSLNGIGLRVEHN